MRNTVRVLFALNMALALALLLGTPAELRADEEGAWMCCQEGPGQQYCCTSCGWLDCMGKAHCEDSDFCNGGFE